MEATFRPPREALPDLPAEELAGAATSASTARPEPEPGPAGADDDMASTQTLLTPEALIAGEDEPTIPALADTPLPELPQTLELDPDAPLTLDTGLEVDRMLSGSPQPPSPVAQPPTVRAPAEAELTLFPASGARAKSPAADSAPKSPAPSPAPAAPALVPLARRASLSAAAEKLAAAAAAAATAPQGAPKPATPAASTAPVAPVKPRAAPTTAPASVTPLARKPAAPAPTTTAEPPPSPAAPSAAQDAPSLASWANARAAAAASARTAASAASRPVAPAANGAPPAAAKPRPAAPPAAPLAAPPAAPPAAPRPPPAATPLPPLATPARGMDRDFIARNQVVDRYFSGKLPIKAATDFERYCKEHPELLDELGLPERVNAGLRLLEASGKPEPWQEAPQPFWQKPAAILGLAGFAMVLAVALALVVSGSAAKGHKILDLQRQVTDRTLDAATSTRLIRLLPSRSGASNTPAIVIGGGAASLVDLHIDETRSPYKDFRVTIDRIDQGRVMVIDNLVKDSNGHLRVAVNSSAFGPGNYLLTIEGLTMRLEPQPDSWVTIGVAQR